MPAAHDSAARPASATTRMRAVVQRRYGPASVLRIDEVDRPTPGPGDVLVRVRAAGVNFADPRMMRGSPFAFRLGYGITRPRFPIPGFDLAGTVEAVGDSVADLARGDDVYGSCRGAYAEYACSTAEHFVRKPINLTFTEAAAVPQTGCVALQALRDVAGLQPGQKVLINGATGGVGTYAVQIAAAFGADVTAVCAADAADLVVDLGANHVIDYTTTDFTLGTERYDVILDNVENHPQSACRAVLRPTGVLVANSGESLWRVLTGYALSPFVRPRLRRFLSLTKPADLLELKELIEAEQVRPVIDQVYPLDEAASALAHMEDGHSRGKVVISV